MSSATQPETQYAAGPAGRVAYQIIGNGPVDLVFVPHWTSNVDVMWEEPSLARFLRRLASFSRLVCFDKRGTGVSDPVTLETPPTLEQWMDDVRVVMDAVGFKCAALFGQGNGGGQMAILFAATYPERTSALVLAETLPRWLRDCDYPCGLEAEQASRALKRVEEIWGTGAALDVVAPSIARDERFRRWYARYERLAMPPAVLVTMYAAGLETDLRGVLPAIRVPTLVIQRADDRYVRFDHGRYLAEHIPGAKYVELPGQDYLFFAGDTDAMLGEIEEFLTGMRSPPAFDRVLATVLFVDIVGSTAHVARLGDRAWRTLLDRYYGVARQEFGRHRGKEIETSGDGILATFDGPARAIRCALAIAQAVGFLGIEVRAGLHTGEIESADDGIRGIAVHVAARVAATAVAGEVLVSSIVRDLVAGSGIRFTDRRIHALKGVPGEWHLFAAS